MSLMAVAPPCARNQGGGKEDNELDNSPSEASLNSSVHSFHSTISASTSPTPSAAAGDPSDFETALPETGTSDSKSDCIGRGVTHCS